MWGSTSSDGVCHCFACMTSPMAEVKDVQVKAAAVRLTGAERPVIINAWEDQLPRETNKAVPRVQK